MDRGPENMERSSDRYTDTICVHRTNDRITNNRYDSQISGYCFELSHRTFDKHKRVLTGWRTDACIRGILYPSRAIKLASALCVFTRSDKL